MNLSAYDKVPDYINKNTTWTDIENQTIISREIKYRHYYCIGTRFDINQKSNIFYLILLDEPPLDRKFYTTRVRNAKLVFRCKDIWSKSSLCELKSNSNISITIVEHTDDGDIYQLDI